MRQIISKMPPSRLERLAFALQVQRSTTELRTAEKSEGNLVWTNFEGKLTATS